MPLFTGRYEYSVDEKGRLSIPIRLREQLTKEGQDATFFITQIHPDFLSAYAANEFQELVNSVAQSSDPGNRELMRRLTSDAVPCPVDQQGRVMLTPELRRLAGLGRDVVVLGVAKRIEIWDRQRYAAHNAAALEKGPNAYAALKAPSDLV